MTLQLMKIEEGLGEGNVIYHALSEYTSSFDFHLFSGVSDEKICMKAMKSL